MTVAYLGPEWAALAESMLRTDRRVQAAAEGLDLTILVRVRDAPPGRLDWFHAAFAGGRLAHLLRGRCDGGEQDAPPATVTLEGAYDAFAAIQNGALSPRRALVSGRLHLGGNRIAALRHMGALEAVATALAAIPAST